MKKRFILLLTAFMLFTSVQSVFAYNYEFGSGPESKEIFGKSTPTDEPTYNPQLENVRRNKDAALIPPAYGIFSGEIPTEQSSRFHTIESGGGARNTTNYSAPSEGAIPNTSTTGGETADYYDANISTGTVLTSTSLMQDSNQTLPRFFEDGSMGTLSIPKLNKTIKVYEGETLANMKSGAAHFESTSAWDGNVCVAGHNRGSAGYFEGVKNLKNGDLIIYETPYGKRTYEVFYKEKISDTDFSLLNWSPENIISLITCVEGVPDIRWAVQAREMR